MDEGTSIAIETAMLSTRSKAYTPDTGRERRHNLPLRELS